MPSDLETIVQRMIDAGEPEESIADVIREYPTVAAGSPHPQPTDARYAGVEHPQARSLAQWASGSPAEDRYQHAKANPGDTALNIGIMALPTVAKQAMPAVIEGGKRLLGISASRAAQNIQTATQAAKDVPLNVEKVGQVGLEAMDLQATGGRMPRVIEQFMRRVTDPTKGELTVEEARKWYSNISRLSANEFNSLNPTMQRQVGAMRSALNESLTGAAETVGQGARYTKGMAEYAKAARAAKTAEDLKGAVTPGRVAKYGAAGGGGLIAWDALMDALSRTAGSR